jgi:hypothetical protein
VRNASLYPYQSKSAQKSGHEFREFFQTFGKKFKNGFDADRPSVAFFEEAEPPSGAVRVGGERDVDNHGLPDDGDCGSFNIDWSLAEGADVVEAVSKPAWGPSRIRENSDIAEKSDPPKSHDFGDFRL